MKAYKVPVEYKSWGLVEVEAENDDDLINKLQDGEFLREMPLPDRPEYVEESYEVDFQSLRDHNPGFNAN